VMQNNKNSALSFARITTIMGDTPNTHFVWFSEKSTGKLPRGSAQEIYRIYLNWSLLGVMQKPPDPYTFFIEQVYNLLYGLVVMVRIWVSGS
ncbi:MAG TPA: hypothetical protein VFI27_01960, partial [candidate division Zixibacteria bacterium]|nr:hypothetical protein [candidate division Zixibacteria bacterium]